MSATPPSSEQATTELEVQDAAVLETPTHDERGMTTAEYAVGTILVVVIVAVLIGIFKSGNLDSSIIQVIKFILGVLMDKGVLDF